MIDRFIFPVFLLICKYTQIQMAGKQCRCGSVNCLLTLVLTCIKTIYPFFFASKFHLVPSIYIGLYFLIGEMVITLSEL